MIHPNTQKISNNTTQNNSTSSKKSARSSTTSSKNHPPSKTWTTTKSSKTEFSKTGLCSTSKTSSTFHNPRTISIISRKHSSRYITCPAFIFFLRHLQIFKLREAGETWIINIRTGKMNEIWNGTSKWEFWNMKSSDSIRYSRRTESILDFLICKMDNLNYHN